MNNGNQEIAPAERLGHSTRTTRACDTKEELSKLKRELLQAEVRLAKARATAAGAEIDVKVLNAGSEPSRTSSAPRRTR